MKEFIRREARLPDGDCYYYACILSLQQFASKIIGKFHVYQIKCLLTMQFHIDLLQGASICVGKFRLYRESLT